MDPTSGSPSISSSSVSLNELPIKNIIEKSNSTESSDCNEEKSIQVPMPLVEENKEPGVSSLQNFSPFFMQKKQCPFYNVQSRSKLPMYIVCIYYPPPFAISGNWVSTQRHNKSSDCSLDYEWCRVCAIA